MKFRKGYKYQVAETISYQTDILGFTIITTRLELNPEGLLTIRDGYAYDGPSGPVIDRRSNMSAAGIHDALCQLMRMELLPQCFCPVADREYAKQLEKCGAWPVTIKINMAGLRFMKGSYARPENRRKVYEVP